MSLFVTVLLAQEELIYSLSKDEIDKHDQKEFVKVVNLTLTL